MINDVLDFSKIEAGKLDLETIEFSPRDCVGTSVEMLAMSARGKGLDLFCRIHADVPDILLGDPGRLRQVLVNLAGNAIKFTHRGEVAVEVRRSPCGEEGSCVLRFSIRDTGIGISPEKRAAIFEPFAQADGSTTRHFGGTGLGLSISSRLARMMNGSISVESTVGEGSVFHFEARFGLPPELEPSFRDASLAGLTALVVDPSATGREIVDEILRQWNILPDLAADAGTALARIEGAKKRGERYGLMILDCDAPGAAEELASNPELTDLPMVMTSYSDRRSAVARSRPAAWTGLVKKPVLEEALLEAVREAGRNGHPKDLSHEIAALSLQIETKPRGFRILVCEDNLINQKVAMRMLISQGHAVTIADDGRKALAALEAEPFDAVLMDVQMPVMDGLEAVAEIRKREQSRGGHIPVIAMTAHTLKGDRERCLAAGMDGYVSKPIDKRQLFETLDRLTTQSPAL